MRPTTRLCTGLVAAALALVQGCAASAPPEPVTPPVTSPAPLPPTDPTPVVEVPAVPDPRACGALQCRLFDGSAEAFRAVLEKRPLALGLGESHGQKDTPGSSSVRRFTAELLPELQGRASDLVVELMMPPRDCDQKTKRGVSREIGRVTAKQAESNQGDYLAMGNAAQKLGIVPHLLRPSCADFKAITAPGADAVWVSLQLITRLMSETAERLLAANAKAGVDKMVVLYGGAIHNDVEPLEAGRDLSFGAQLQKTTQGRYVELDMFVPELIDDKGLWRRFSWFPHFDRKAHPEHTTLFTVGPGAYTMLFSAGR